MGKKSPKGKKHTSRSDPDEDENHVDAAKEHPEGDAGADDSSSDDSSSDEEDDDLILEGVMCRVPGVSSSDEDELSSEEEGDDGPAAKKRKMQTPLPEEYASKKQAKDEEPKKKKAGEIKKKKSKGKGTDLKKSESKAKKKSPAEGEPDIVDVDFIFCDMEEKFYHGMKTLLMSNPVYASHSSALSDLMIDNVSVGTVISTEGCDEGEENVFGFASVLNVTTYGSAPCVQYLKKLCLDNCPDRHMSELQTVLSGETRRPAGFLVHNRMVNTPLEITEVLHQQLVLDMDWAVKNAEGGEEERKSLDFGAFVLMAPCTRPGGDGTSLIYKNFDDEIFASNAEFVYTFETPRAIEDEEKQLCSVIVMTKTGHRDGMKDLAKLIRGSK